MKIVLIKTQVGTFIGEPINPTEGIFDIGGLMYPCMIEFIPVPVQSNLGRGSMAIGRLISPWPFECLHFEISGSVAGSIFDTDKDSDNQLVNDYLRARKETWKTALKIVN